MRMILVAACAAVLAGCGARPVVQDSLRSPGVTLRRTSNYTKPELEDLKNRGHTYLADIKTAHAAVLDLCKLNRLRFEMHSDFLASGAAQIVTTRSNTPAGPINQTLRAINAVFDDVKLTAGRYYVEIGVTSRAHDRTNVIIREYFEAYDSVTRDWKVEYIPPGYVTKDLFRQLDRRLRVIKNPSELMWRNW
jgi:hypothetical protein